MVINAAFLAFKRLVSPQFHWIMWQSLGVALLALTLIWFAAQEFLLSYFRPWISDFMQPAHGWASWLAVIAAISSGLGLAMGMAFLIAPTTALFGSFFTDKATEIIEKEDYPQDTPGKAMPAGRAFIVSCRFVLLNLAGNLLALVLLLVPGINMAAFLVINGYLLGQEYFEFAAARFQSRAQIRACYKANVFVIFFAGLVIALFLCVPFLNLLTPLFATALMTHLHKFLSDGSRQKQIMP